MSLSWAPRRPCYASVVRRELAVYTKRGDLLLRTWIEEEEVDHFTSEFRQSGYVVVDVELMGRTLNLTDPYARLGHILRNPQAVFAEPTQE